MRKKSQISVREELRDTHEMEDPYVLLFFYPEDIYEKGYPQEWFLLQSMAIWQRIGAFLSSQ